jgi:hypothetical protein
MPTAEQAVVTGSHIPQRRLPACSGAPTADSNVRVYCRDQLNGTGHTGDFAAALQQLDPSFTAP